jgi:hypothetical protein
MTPRVLALHVWPPDADQPEHADELLLDWGGPVGDRHYGETMSSDIRQRGVYERGTQIRNHRQMSLVDAAELGQIAASLGIDGMAPGVIADNVATEGLPHLTALPRMTRMAFPSGAVLMPGGENNPCTVAGTMVQRRYGTRPEAFPAAAIHRRGVTGWVERPGTIRTGDAISLHLA